MRDNEFVPVSDVIKALEYCLKNDVNFCRLCSYDKHGQGCRYLMANDLLELVKRQRAEIEELEEYGAKRFDDFATEYDNKMRAEAIENYVIRLKERINFNYGGEVFATVKVITMLIESTKKEMMRYLENDM